MSTFLPVATGSRDRRGFETAPTKRLATLLAGQIVSELHDEFARRGQTRTAAP